MILNIHKPVGWTSFDVVKKIRSITREKKVGHGGTLDP
ncbi:MAG: tRNA pseudouridine(55) synthase TruB, partial [Candidatus Neomarinimicrobiota bacterium]|nr:tRNA pseudouridine(55) synthase TruB [Candidatus Neomarinimicrobiota bacterium]